MFGRKKKDKPEADAADDDEPAPPPPKKAAKEPAPKEKAAKEKEPEAPAEDGKPAPAAKGGKLGLILGLVVVTAIAAGTGAGLGMILASTVEAAVNEKAKAIPEKPPVPAVKYSGDLVLHDLQPVIANLAAPADTWIRLETAIIFENGAVENPQVTGAEIEQDILGYARTMTLDQFRGPSALQHLRDDLNERVAIRTNKAVRELVIKTMVVQ